MDKQHGQNWFERTFGINTPEPPKPPVKEPIKEFTLQPALRQLGTVNCPVCKHETAVFLTKTNRPFVNCGFCSVRIFYNGRESMRLLKLKLKAVD